MKRLIFRLSSLGDVILSQSSLETPFAGETDWVVAREFETLLEGHPRIRKLWAFDRRSAGSLVSWARLIRALAQEDYAEVVDLHSTLRTWVARVLFRIHSPRTRWKKLSKERGRRLGYSVFKKLWPRHWRPRHLARKSALLAGGTGNEKPDLRWMTARSLSSAFGALAVDASAPFFAVSPSSAWSSKEWPADRYLPMVQKVGRAMGGAVPVLLGTERDLAALAVRAAFQEANVPFVDALGKLTLQETAAVLSKCRLAIGPDTGLMHLAEAMGTPVVSLFGPTRTDYGFGPLDPRSRSIEGQVVCAPCSKDGRICYRFGDRFACLRKIDVDSVVTAAAGISDREPRDV